MADSYHIIDGQVVPFSGGRKCNDTDAWRDATPLELQLQEQLEEYEHTIAAQAAEIEALREERDAHVSAVSAGGWYQGDDRTCGPSATTCRFIRDDDGIVAYVDGGTRAEAAARGARIVACVNACTGIADPGALVQAARDAVDWIGACVPDSVGGREFTLTNLRRALGALLRDQEEGKWATR